MALKRKPSGPAKKAPVKPITSAPDKPKVMASQNDFDGIEEERRIRDVSSARTIYNRFVQDDTLRSMTAAQVRGQLEGNRPRDPQEMINEGTAWETNVNFGDAQAARDQTLLPFWKRVMDVPNKAVFDIDLKTPALDKFKKAFSECFDEFLADWSSGHYIEFMKFCKNYVDFGPGIPQWTDPDSPRWTSINVNRVYWPKNTQMQTKEWEVVALTRDMSASEMYKKIKDKKSADAGWNIDALKTAIVQCHSASPTPDYRDYTKVSDQLVNNDIAISTPFQPLETIWLYVRQFSGKIGCYVFTRSQGVDDFLFSDFNHADDFKHILGPVWYDTGTDGMIHSIKGFGIKNYYFSALVNRMKSRYVDSGIMSMGVNFQYDNENTPTESPPVEQYGPFTVFPTGLKQLAVYPQLQGASGVIEMLMGNQNQNNSIYRQQEKQIENSDTATQANILANLQGEMASSSAAIFLSQIGDNVFTEQVRRLRKRGNTDKDAVKFVKRLRDRGVPDKVIFDADMRVKAGANASMFSPALRAQMFQQDLALMNMPGINGRWFLENLIANKYGAYAVDQALLPLGQDSAPEQRRQAEIENVMFGQGAPMQVAQSDAHFEHVQEHLKPLTALVGKAEQGNAQGALQQNGPQLSPEEATALMLGVEHTGQHMGYLQQDDTMKAQFQQVLPIFRKVQASAKGILTQMQAAAQQQQAQNSGQMQQPAAQVA